MTAKTIYRDIDRWEATAVIDKETALKLRAELDSQPITFSLASILSMIAALLIGAAVITFIAANWQEMPRLFRVTLICLAILLGYSIGGWRFMRGDKILSEGCFLIGALSFGAGIALTGQMYHLSGDTMSVLRLWCLSTGGAAFFLRSQTLAVLTILLAAVFTGFSFNYNNDASFFVIAKNSLLLMATYGLCLWTQSRLAHHVWMLHLLVFVSSLLIVSDAGDDYKYLVAGFFVILFLVSWLNLNVMDRAFSFSVPFGNWSLLFAFSFLWARQFDILWSSTNGFPFVKAVVASAIILLCLLALWSGRERGWSTILIALIALIAEIYYLIWETIDSLFMQSIFFLITAILFFVMARLALRNKGEQL